MKTKDIIGNEYSATVSGKRVKVRVLEDLGTRETAGSGSWFFSRREAVHRGFAAINLSTGRKITVTARRLS